MGTFQSWRQAYGALKDTTKVGLAKVNSEFKELDIAVVKATNHAECPPKERHVRKIFAATAVDRPRTDVAYCVHILARRLAKTRNWVVALKTLIVIHRVLREGDPTFREDLLNYSRRGNVLRISNFKDDSSSLAWDCSAWVRTYALFLEERLECFRILKYDIEAERLRKFSDGDAKGQSRTRNLGCQDLLDQLPALQNLLYRLVGCQPEGAAFGNYLIQYALALVLKESFKIYCAINDGIINLVDLFFEMSRHDAIKALDIYKRAGQLAENLGSFYGFCKGLELARNFQFPILSQPPPSFLATMEEYIREAPHVGSVSNKTLEYEERKLLTNKQEESSPSESQKSRVEDEKKSPAETEEKSQPIMEVAAQPATTVDLLGLDEINPVAAELEESNALALAIIPQGDDSKPSDTGGLVGGGIDPSGWELALVTTPSSDSNQLTENKLAGGFNKLLLDSLYDDASRWQQNTGAYSGFATNPFDSQDPFAVSNNFAAPPNVQMALIAQQQQQQQQQYYQQQQNMMMMPDNYQPHYPHSQAASTNPFADHFAGFTQAAALHGRSGLI